MRHGAVIQTTGTPESMAMMTSSMRCIRYVRVLLLHRGCLQVFADLAQSCWHPFTQAALCIAHGSSAEDHQVSTVETQCLCSAVPARTKQHSLCLSTTESWHEAGSLSLVMMSAG